MKTGFVVYPWDLIDAGVDETLDGLVGRWGVNHLTVWGLAPDVQYVRIQGKSPRLVQRRGGLLVDPRSLRRISQNLSPAPHWNPADFERLVASCQVRSMDLTLALSMRAVAGERPELLEHVSVNCLGQRSQLGACPLHPTTLKDIEQIARSVGEAWGVRSIRISDWICRYADLQSAQVDRPACIDESMIHSLSVCFCASCRDHASNFGLSGLTLMRRCADAFEASIRGQLTPPQNDDLLQRYREVQFEGVVRALTTIAQTTSMKVHLLVDRFDPGFSAMATSMRSAAGETKSLDSQAPREWTADLFAAIDRLSSNRLGIVRVVRSLERCLRDCGHGRRASWPTAILEAASPERIVAMAAELAEHGCQGIDVDHWAMVSAAKLDDLHNAFRFAKRLAVAE